MHQPWLRIDFTGISEEFQGMLGAILEIISGVFVEFTLGIFVWLVLLPVLWLVSFPIILIVALFKPAPYLQSVGTMLAGITAYWRDQRKGFTPL